MFIFHHSSVISLFSVFAPPSLTMASACTTETFNSSEESSYETIQKLKDVYGQQCRVITDVGEYAYVINVKLYDALLSIKFQLAGNRPEYQKSKCVCRIVMKFKLLEICYYNLHVNLSQYRTLHIVVSCCEL